jgi:hypothetical protein
MGSLLQAILQKKASCLDCRLIATLGEASPAARRISILVVRREQRNARNSDENEGCIAQRRRRFEAGEVLVKVRAGIRRLG